MRLSPSLAVTTFALLASFACTSSTPEPPAKDYQLAGQILAVNSEKPELTIKHDDIKDFMPAMTMVYEVADKGLMSGRTPGELITATLHVRNSIGTITAITHTGEGPLPNENQVAMASGVLAEGDAVPDAAFVDQTDKRRSFSEWNGATTLVTFIYTRCPLPDFCPLMNQHFATIQKAIATDAALKGQVKLVSITFDPEYDTPAVLADVAKKHGADAAVWTFLTGDRVTIHRFAGRFGVGLIRPDGMIEISHNLRTVLIDASGHIRKIYSGNDWKPSTVLADMRATNGK